ncbi:zinc finger protein 37 homolog [Anopheles stephensi]|uniref:zinc finger protein 37 homolog n=1 Tax=Anopheles stephensi TaxID=30069 RepID=UPI0016587B7D|nr:zinc finger protein 37 homolog [Anopheles stephensi]
MKHFPWCKSEPITFNAPRVSINMQSQPQSSGACGITSWMTPLMYDGHPMHLSGAIKVENVQQDRADLIKRDHQPQKHRSCTETTRYALPPNTHSMDGVGREYSFVDEIEIGETRMMSSIGHEHVQVKLEYNSNDEMSVEPNVPAGSLSSIREDRKSPHTAAPNTERLQENRNLPFPCEYCELSFYNTRQLNNHRRNHQLEECPVCKKTTIARYMKEHIALNHPQASVLPEKRTYKCDQCDKIFYCKTLLIDHRRNHQTKECPVCGQLVKSRVLSMHIARKHSAPSERGTFRCDQCDKTCASKAQLADHQRDHLVKNCTVCNVRILARCMKKHMARKHPPDGGNRSLVRSSFQCEWCDKAYSNKRSLALHQMNHPEQN